MTLSFQYAEIYYSTPSIKIQFQTPRVKTYFIIPREISAADKLDK